jgi:hypothetical protein
LAIVLSVLYFFFFWPLRCLSFFDLRIMISPLYRQTLLMSLLHDVQRYFS